jgi:hypothetical protein
LRKEVADWIARILQRQEKARKVSRKRKEVEEK